MIVIAEKIICCLQDRPTLCCIAVKAGLYHKAHHIFISTTYPNFSSPEHKLLMVRYCDLSMSVM